MRLTVGSFLTTFYDVGHIHSAAPHLRSDVVKSGEKKSKAPFFVNVQEPPQCVLCINVTTEQAYSVSHFSSPLALSFSKH